MSEPSREVPPSVSARAPSAQSSALAAARSRNQARREGSGRRSTRSSGRTWLAPVAVMVVVVVGGIATVAAARNSSGHSMAAPSVGQMAPAGTFQTASAGGDGTGSVASLRGHPTLLWFVATWCSSCQAGNQAIAQNLSTLRQDGVRVVELELAGDLGTSGPSITQMVQDDTGSPPGPGWTLGVASPAMTAAYDPKAFLDIYYFLDASGKVRLVSGAPASTMGQLLSQAAAL